MASRPRPARTDGLLGARTFVRAGFGKRPAAGKKEDWRGAPARASLQAILQRVPDGPS